MKPHKKNTLQWPCPNRAGGQKAKQILNVLNRNLHLSTERPIRVECLESEIVLWCSLRFMSLSVKGWFGNAFGLKWTLSVWWLTEMLCTCQMWNSIGWNSIYSLNRHKLKKPAVYSSTFPSDSSIQNEWKWQQHNITLLHMMAMMMVMKMTINFSPTTKNMELPVAGQGQALTNEFMVSFMILSRAIWFLMAPK